MKSLHYIPDPSNPYLQMINQAKSANQHTQTSNPSINSASNTGIVTVNNQTSRLENVDLVRQNFFASFRRSDANTRYWIIMLIVYYMTRMISGFVAVSLSQVNNSGSSLGFKQISEPLFIYCVGYMLIMSLFLPIQLWNEMFLSPSRASPVSEEQAQQQQRSVVGRFFQIRLGHFVSDLNCFHVDFRNSLMLLQCMLSWLQLIWLCVGVGALVSVNSFSPSSPLLFSLAMFYVVIDVTALTGPYLFKKLVWVALMPVIGLMILLNLLSCGRFVRYIDPELNDRPDRMSYIIKLKVEVYSKAKSKLVGEDAACVICSGEYEDGDRLTFLPACQHHFHFGCVGKWLQIKNTCPLCVRKVDGKMIKVKRSSDDNV